MRQFVVVALVSVLSLLVATAGAVAGAETVATGQTDPPVTVSVTGGDTVSPGNTTTVAVDIDSSVAVYAAQFTLVVEPTTVGIGSSTRGSYLSRNGSTIVVANEINPSNVTYGETRIESERGVAGTGTLATVTLTVPDDIDSDNMSLHLTDVSVVDPSIESLPARTENKTITVPGANDDEETTQPSGPLDDGDTSGDTDGSTGDSGSADGSTDDGDDTAESTGPTDGSTDTTPPEWQSRVDQRIINEMDGGGTSPVLVEIRSPRATELGQVAARLNESGLRNATLNRELQIVRGTVERDSLSRVANVSGVTRIRYDLSVDQQSSPMTPSDSSTVTGSPERTPTTSNTTATSTGGPGFTAPLTLIGAVVCLLLMGRQASV